ncbi:MAG: alkaline phosphatase family protein [Acidobacteria bacterium]|nr:alkaline phosphatase family protein [Acidobacteriota bacterium]
MFLFFAFLVHEPSITMPSKASTPDQIVTRLAFGSCFNPMLDRDEIFETIANYGPDLFLMCGDNVYQEREEDDPELVQLRNAYHALANNRRFAHLRETVSLAVMWDDHDYGFNDADGSWPYKAQSEALFEHVWAIPEQDPRLGRPGIYTSMFLGEAKKMLQIIMLDTRYFRSSLKATDEPLPGKERYLPDDDPNKTMLGADQWAWLHEQLRQPADLRIIVSSVQVLPVGHGFECWQMLPIERAKLLGMLAESGDKLIVLLTGDRHFAGYYREKRSQTTFVELTSSALNYPITDDRLASAKAQHEPMEINQRFFGANFGSLEMDWQNRLLKLQLRDTQGTVVREEQVHY